MMLDQPHQQDLDDILAAHSTKPNVSDDDRTPVADAPHRSSVSYAQMMLQVSLFMLLTVGTSFAILLLQLPSLLLNLHSHELYRSYIRLTEQIFGSICIATLYLLSPETKLIVSGDIDMIKPHSKSIWISNHQLYLDWIYLWTLAWSK
jgi:1-acyl-sn-glycerol-3-phosphate acyltransferase